MISNKSFNGDGEKPYNSSQFRAVLAAQQLIYLINNHVIGMLSHVCKLWAPWVTLLLNPTLIKRNKSTCYFHLLNHGNCWKAWSILRGTFDSNETVKCKAPLWIIDTDNDHICRSHRHSLHWPLKHHILDSASFSMQYFSISLFRDFFL